MGGPLSLLAWNLSFDPAIWASGLVACCEILAYVDDLLANVIGPGQLLLAYMLLLAATNTASLKIEDHSCVQIKYSHGRAEANEFLRAFPTGFTPNGPQGFRLTFGPVEIYRDLLDAANVLPPNTEHRLIRTYCVCRTKHAVVPAHSHQLWADALRGTPMAPAVTAQTQFLGVGLCSRVRPQEGPLPIWSNQALTVCKARTWESAINKCRSRAQAALTAGLSLSLRAESWNTHCASTLPYAATTVLPGENEKTQLLAGLFQRFPTGRWAWNELPMHLASFLGLSHGPRDPRLVAITTGVSQTLIQRFVGPPQAQYEVDVWLAPLRQWAEPPEAEV